MGAVDSARDQSEPRRGGPHPPCLPLTTLHRTIAERQLWHERSCVQGVCRPEHNKGAVLPRLQSDAEVARSM